MASGLAIARPDAHIISRWTPLARIIGDNQATSLRFWTALESSTIVHTTATLLNTRTLTMRLLFLGGTLFVGRHLVEAALMRDHDVTLFHRGQTNPDLFPGVEHLYGDREGDLSVLGGRRW